MSSTANSQPFRTIEAPERIIRDLSMILFMVPVHEEGATRKKNAGPRRARPCKYRLIGGCYHPDHWDADGPGECYEGCEDRRRF